MRSAEIESALALSLLQAAWWGVVLGLAAAVVLAAMARRSAAARHVVGLGFLVAMLVVPVWHFVALLAGAPDAIDLGIRSGSTFVASPVALVGVAAHLPCGRLTSLWAAGVLAMFVRLAGGMWLLRGLARLPAAPLPPAWQAPGEVKTRSAVARCHCWWMPAVFRRPSCRDSSSPISTSCLLAR